MANCPVDLFEDIDKWNYFGIDQNLYSLAHVLDAYNSPSTCDLMKQRFMRSKWLCANIGGVNANTVEKMSLGTFRDHKYEIFVPSLSLSELFEAFQIETIDILMMDIEGSEYKAFKDYDWKIKPRLICIEIHPEYAESAECAIKLWSDFENQGYQLNWSESGVLELDHFNYNLYTFVLVD